MPTIVQGGSWRHTGSRRMLRVNHIRELAVIVAVALAAGVLALLGASQKAEAAFPGNNGKIAFVSDRTTGLGVSNPTGDNEIFTMNPDGTGILQATFNTADDRN